MTALRSLRRYVVAGLLVLLPMVGTWFALAWLFDLLDGVGQRLVRLAGYQNLRLPGLGLLLELVLVVVVGALTSLLLGRRLHTWAESMVLRVPVVSSVYGLAKGITDSLLGGKGQAFQSAALVQYPRIGVYSIAFITGSTGSLYHLFIPASPPVSGLFIMVPRDQVVVLRVPVDAALKLLVSGGLFPLAPEGQEEVAATVERIAAERGTL